MNNIHLFISGILIGSGVVLPGISGAVIAIIMGIYDYVIFTLNNLEIKLKDKIFKLFPLFIGLVLGIVIFGNLLLILYDNFQYEMMYIFMGLILGEIPLLESKVENVNGNNLNKKYIVVSTIISFALVVLPQILNFNAKNPFNPFNLFFSGFLYISGKIIPGISSSLFLMIFGLYEYVLNLISNPFLLTLNQIVLLIPFFLGIICGFFLFIKLINYLFNNFYSQTYSIIIGFVIGSIFAIYPGFKTNLEGITSLIFMIISFVFTYKMSKKN